VLVAAQLWPLEESVSRWPGLCARLVRGFLDGWAAERSAEITKYGEREEWVPRFAWDDDW